MNDPAKWWDTRLKDPKAFDFFVENLGGTSMPSRVLARELAVGRGITSVLDVGCGPAIDRWQDAKGIAWRGCDASRLICDTNRERGITIDFAAAHLLPYKARSYDLVYARHVWEHLPHFLPALKEACRVAKRGVMTTFFQPPGSHERITVADGAHYNDYKLADITAAFMRIWPDCVVSMHRLPQQKFLPHGELILFATRPVESP